MTWLDIIGLKVVAIKAYRADKRQKQGPYSSRYEIPDYVFFDDGETYIHFEEQDYHTYHDASTLARESVIYKNKNEYDSLISWDNLIDYRRPNP